VSWPNPLATANGEDFRADEPDVVVLVGSGQQVGLEVKGRIVTFSGPEDFLYPLAVVGSIRRWATRQDASWAMVLVSMPNPSGRIVIKLAITPTKGDEREGGVGGIQGPRLAGIHT
jgi:hypothetical protein